MIMEFFKQKFGVQAKFKDLRKFNQVQIEKALLKRGLKKRKTEAAIKIQSHFRGAKTRKEYKTMLKDREVAAGVIKNGKNILV